MKFDKNNTAAPLMLIFMGWGTIYFLISALFGLWTERNLEYALTLYKHSPVDIPYFIAFIAQLCLPPFMLAFNVFMEILRFAI